MSDQAVRLSVFLGTLTLIALWELCAPRRPLQQSKGARWRVNLALIAVDSAVVKVLFPVLPYALAETAAARGWGIGNSTHLPHWLHIATSLILLDFIIYLQHLLFHHVPLLWRVHRMHHSDLDLDVTSGNRFHPLEIIISLLIKMTAIVLLGVPPQAVLIFETALNASAMFNHGNILLPAALDQYLRLLLVTPDMHRVHHSVIVKETNSNFGFCLPWWDRLCRTYTPQPHNGHQQMTIGLREYRDPGQLTLLHLLLQPFRTAPNSTRQ